MAPSTAEKKKMGGGIFGFGSKKAKSVTPETITKGIEKALKDTSVPSPASAATGLKAPALTPAKVTPLATNVTATAIPVTPTPAPISPADIRRKLMGAGATTESAVAPEVPSAIHLRREDAAAAWQSRPRMPSRLMDTYVNFIVLGESGLGKTTFIKNLTSSFKVINAGRVHDGSSTTLSQFQADPEGLRTVLEPMEIPESSRRLMISIQDMPGWGDDINLVRYLRMITTFLLEQRAKDYDKLAGGRALDETAMCGQLQHSITACLYFIPPHRVKKIDLVLMAAISQLVTIIPVIGKADAMTEPELAAYRTEVLSMLNSPSKFVAARSLPHLEVSIFNFAESIMTDLGMSKSQLPIAVVTSREAEACDDPAFLSSLGLEEVSNPTQPVRQYRWGSVYPLNRSHSDLIVLKRLLLGDRVESLYAMLDDSYKRYMAFCSSYEESGKQLQMVVQDACLVGGPHLEYDDYAKAKLALDSAKAAMTTLSEENRILAERLAAVEKEKKQLQERIRA